MASGSHAESPAGNPSQAYACKCLNVQITSSTQAPASSPEGTCDPSYEPVFVKDEGIVITHPQVTVRTTTHAEPIPGTARHSRFIVLTCLLCQLPAYRVYQTISLDIQGNESILLPTDTWVEREILKSSTGWIQVHKDGIVGDSICQAMASPSYSRPFSMLLPSEPPSLIVIPSSPKMNTETSPSSSAELPSLPAMPPLFYPPPFTPSHPIFMHLASIANEESQNLRGTAEQRIADFVKAEMAAIEASEQSLRHQVEVFWTTYKDHLNALEGEPSKPTSNVARTSVSHGGFGPGGLGAVISNSSVTIRNFVPVPISPPLSPMSPSPRTSALSASLATSTFHHLNVIEARTHSSSYSESVSSHTLSTSSGSSTLSPEAVPVTNILQYKRNVNDDINTQASYRYFVNLEEDMARYKRKQEATLKEQQEAEAGKRAQQAPTQAESSGVNTNGNLKHEIVVQAQTTTEDGSARHEETILPKGRDKGKRKVTFNVEMTIKKEEADGKVEEDVTTEQDPGEMVFALEDLEGEEDTRDSSDTQHSTLPLLEQAVPRSLRPRTTRSQNNIEIFSSLRPSSLPNPSHIRPMRAQAHVDSSSHVMLPRSKVLITPTPGGSRSPPLQHGSSPQMPTEHDAELLRLVAADTPSHRGAWTPDSKAWRTFIRRQDLKEDVDRSSRIPEEGEEMDSAEEEFPVVTEGQLAHDGYNVNVSPPTSSSVPINIVIRNRLPEPLSLSSYRPKTTVTPNQPRSSNGDVPSSLAHGQKTTSSSTSIRKAKYAERDRVRSMDPGTLDFATIVEEDVVEEETLTDQTSGERGRKLALKILKSRNELPETRSLA